MSRKVVSCLVTLSLLAAQPIGASPAYLNTPTFTNFAAQRWDAQNLSVKAHVPRYGPLQVTPSGGASAYATAPIMPDVGAQQSQQHVVGVVGKIIDDILQRDNQLRVDDATNQHVKAVRKMRAEAMQLRGRSALERADGFGVIAKR